MAAQTKEDLLLLIQTHQDQIKAFGVSRLGIFGSFARGQQKEESDVDVLVEFMPGRKTFDAFIHLAFFLEELFGRPVELVTSESLSPYIGPHILSETEYANLSAGVSASHHRGDQQCAGAASGNRRSPSERRYWPMTSRAHGL